MSILWMDGFEHYGTGATGQANMLDGVYAIVENSLVISSTFQRTGNYSARIDKSQPDDVYLRRVFGKVVQSGEACGFGGAYYMSELPTFSNAYCIARFLNQDNEIQYEFFVDTTGCIICKRGNGSNPSIIDFQGTVPAVVSDAWQHIEFRVDVHSANGAVEVRVNGVTVANVTMTNTNNQTPGGIAQVGFGIENNFENNGFFIDDIFAWDSSGTTNNDFIGDRRVLTIVPDADTSLAELAVVGPAEGYQAIDEMPPDDDASYLVGIQPIGSPLDPNMSEFGLQNLPATVVAVTAIQSYVRMRKSDAGTCKVQTSLLFNGDAAAGADRQITEEWTYWMDVFELNPDTGAPWTPAQFNSTLLRLSRTE